MAQQGYRGEQIDPFEVDRAGCRCGTHPDGRSYEQGVPHRQSENPNIRTIEDMTDDPRTIGLLKGLFKKVER